jgi:serine/threonine protein kinase
MLEDLPEPIVVRGLAAPPTDVMCPRVVVNSLLRAPADDSAPGDVAAWWRRLQAHAASLSPLEAVGAIERLAVALLPADERAALRESGVGHTDGATVGDEPSTPLLAVNVAASSNDSTPNVHTPLKPPLKPTRPGGPWARRGSEQFTPNIPSPSADSDPLGIPRGISLTRGETMRLSRQATVDQDEEGNETVNGYTLWQELGRGTAGVCFLAFDESATDTRAIKVIPRANRHGPEQREMLTEVAIMKKLRHKHIVKIHECIDDPEAEAVYLVMQYIPDGPIAKLNDEGKCAPMSLSTVAHYGAQLASALKYMHRKGVMHGDIKPDNILVDSSGADRMAYLSDFGVSRAFLRGRDIDPAFLPSSICNISPRHLKKVALTPPDLALSAAGAALSVLAAETPGHSQSSRRPPEGGLFEVFGTPTHAMPPAHTKMNSVSNSTRVTASTSSRPSNTANSQSALARDMLLSIPECNVSLCLRPVANQHLGCGTPAFLSPEMFAGSPPTIAADMWAFGVTLYVMIYGCLPFTAPTYFAMKQTVTIDELEFPPAAPATLKWRDVLRRLLEKDSALRMTAAEARYHPLLSGSPVAPSPAYPDSDPFAGIEPFNPEASMEEGAITVTADEVDAAVGTSYLRMVRRSVDLTA